MSWNKLVVWAFAIGLTLISGGCGGNEAASPGGTPPLTGPLITQQPQPLTVTAGQTATFTVAAGGSPSPSFSWETFKNGDSTWSTVAGATSTTCSFTAQAGDDGAQFRAKATNSTATVTSSVAVLTVAAQAQPVLHVAIAVHSEDRHNPQTLDYQTDKAAYAASRAALLVFAQAMASRQLKWNWQSDYNFLEACRKWEITTPDAVLLALTAGKNVVRYLHENLGVECDPHSHENDGYNYADIAYLLQACGVTPTSIVGGHTYDPSDPTYQNWPRFNAGISGQKYPSYFWKPELLMGAATADHHNDPTASGMWRPQSAASFFTPGGSGVASFGGWDGQVSSISALAQRVATGQLAAEKLWTFGYVLAQQYFVQAGYLESQVFPALDQIVSLRNAGAVKVVQFTEALEVWKTQYGSSEAVIQSEAGVVSASYFTFTLNTQDFSYPEESSALVTKALNLHEAAGVPIDVSFTTSQALLYATQYPDLWARLKGSPQVALSTHTRAPKPYANNFDWAGMEHLSQTAQQALVLSYETWSINPATGQLTGEPGGYSQVKALAGYAPFCIGARADAPVVQAVCTVFAGLGARFVVAHGKSTNLGESTLGLALKPEHVDLKLYESVGLEPGPVLEAALLQAAALSGAKPPFFVGVKMHDNDFFAQDSAWVTVYNNNGHGDLTPPWDLTKKSPLLSQAERDAMWTLYEKAVRYAASIRARVGLVNLRDIAGMLP